MTQMTELTSAELAEIEQRFASFDYDAAREYGPGDELSPEARLVRAAAARAYYQAQAESVMREAVSAARAGGLSWHRIGLTLGTTGEAARQRYAHAQPG